MAIKVETSSGAAIAAGWSEGYVTDTLYTDHVFREQSPVWINYVATLMGCVPRPLDQPFSYLELGCGLGHSITVFAAACPEGRFVGVDFNPAHIDHAQRRARTLGLNNLTFVEASFQDLAADAAGQGIARDLGHFDFAALHGIYSWISPEARRAVQRLLFDRLKSGGLVYNSYNCLPGWATEAPLQRLLKEFAATGSGGSGQRIRNALGRINALAAIKSGYLSGNQQAMSALNVYSRKPDNYLAHEFLNGEWNAFYAADVADEMAEAKLDFVGSATLMENHRDLLLSDAAIALVGEQPDERRRQMVQDFLINQKFRRDVFVRGHARLSQAEIAANRARQYLVAPKSLSALDPKIKVPRGTVTVDPEKFKHLIAVLKDRAGTEGDFAAAFAKASGAVGEFSRLIGILAATNNLMPAAKASPAPAKTPTIPGEIARQTLPLKANAVELAAALAKKSNVLLISPVTGNGVSYGLTEILLLNELLSAGGTPVDLVSRVRAQMQARGVRPSKNAKAMTDPDEITAHLQKLIEDFSAKDLPALTRLGVVTQA
nr:class I SAM-dependent methyltransferase [uncultured Dongia sp.]